MIPNQPISQNAQHMNTVTDGELFYQISQGRKTYAFPSKKA